MQRGLRIVGEERDQLQTALRHLRDHRADAGGWPAPGRGASSAAPEQADQAEEDYTDVDVQDVTRVAGPASRALTEQGAASDSSLLVRFHSPSLVLKLKAVSMVVCDCFCLLHVVLSDIFVVVGLA